MRKYLNKGLLYEWFNAAKVPIVIGLVMWGFFSYFMLKDNIVYIQSTIAQGDSNNFETIGLSKYIVLGFIFLAIYIFANGANKRNTTMFLCSGPYTKKQIKVNELICLLMTLVLFIAMFIYIAVTIYVRNHEFMAIVNGYYQVVLIEIIRLVLFGTIGILLMIEIDMLFSNSIAAYFGMLSLLISTLLIWGKCGSIINYTHISSIIMNKVFGYTVDYNYNHAHDNILFNGRPYYSGEIGSIVKGIACLIFVIIILLVLFNILEKKYKLEASSKIFSCKLNEKMVSIYLSLGIASFFNLMFVDGVLTRYMDRTIWMQEYFSFESFEMLVIDLISIGIIAFISNKLIRRALTTLG